MYIHLIKEEITYMHKAIDEWHAGALEHIKKMQNYTNDYDNDYDGYDPFPPGKCIMLTKAQQNQVIAWTREFDLSWEKNGGKIDLDFFCSRILKYSVHKNQQDPSFLSIREKVEKALAAKSYKNGPLEKQGMFAASTNTSDQKSEKTETSNISVSSTPSISSMLSTPTIVKANSTQVKIPHGFECPITLEIMKDPVICTLDSQTYERKAIVEWLSEHNTAPNNRKKMDDKQKIEELLIPNRALEESIQEFKQEHPELFPNSVSSFLNRP